MFVDVIKMIMIKRYQRVHNNAMNLVYGVKVELVYDFVVVILILLVIKVIKIN